ncbi:MAG: Agmatinase [Dehalococcoidia bacterium]|nr:Agmatinase [Dehalococcoidia bacterium]
MPLNSTGSEAASVVILPVPYDATQEWRTGAREGPQAIITASPYLELYDLELGYEVHQMGIHTLPEIEPVMGNPAAMLHRVYENTLRWLDRGKKVVMLGGEHSLTTGAVRAYREKFPQLSVLHLDAHADLRHEYLGTIYSHACAMRRVMELCPVVSAGVRSLSLEESDFIKSKNIKLFYAGEKPLDEADISGIISALSDDVYITIDMDVFDPSIMPAVGTPEPGGLGWHEVLRLLREVARQKRVAGFDLVELCPREGPTSCAYLAAKLAYKLIGYSFARR